MSTTEERNLPSLTSLRWYAALLVFFLHVHAVVGFDWQPLGPFGVGYVGVSFFFILSGFVLTWSAPAVVEAGRFYWRRFARIYPLHLATFLVAGAIAAVGGSSLLHVDALSGVFNLFLIHPWWPGFRMVEPWNGVSWSLGVEAFFYLCFPALAVWVRRQPRAGVGVLAALLAGLLTLLLLREVFGIQGGATAYFNPLARLPEFVLGVWLAVRVRSGWRVRVPLWAAVLLVLVSGIVGWRELLPYYPVSNYLMIPSFALLITAAAERDADRTGGLLENLLRQRCSQYLGTVSFAFYLVHNMVIRVLFHATSWDRPWSTVGGLAPTFIALVASFVAAAVLHHCVEVPARKWLLRDRRPTDAPAVSTARQKTAPAVTGEVTDGAARGDRA